MTSKVNPNRLAAAEHIVKSQGRMTLRGLREMLDIQAPKYDASQEVTSRNNRRKIPLTESEVQAMVAASDHLVFDAEATDEVVYVKDRAEKSFYETSRYWDN